MTKTHLCTLVTGNEVGEIRGHAKFMGYTGPAQMGYRARIFHTYINNGAGTFLGNIYMGQILFGSLLSIIFTPDTIYADNKGKPMAGCQSRIFKRVFEKLLTPNIHHNEIMIHI